MTKISVVILLIYFLSGTIFLPQGDFSTLPDLPKMYAQCKNNEDADMNLPDFITEHLLEVDGIFGIDEHDSNEKPHQPVQFHHQLAQLIFIANQIKIEFCLPESPCKKINSAVNNLCLSDYITNVFHPPIA